jgi:hypothetical protein
MAPPTSSGISTATSEPTDLNAQILKSLGAAPNEFNGSNGPNDDDGFGDFGDFGSSAAPTASPEAASILDKIPDVSFMLSDKLVTPSLSDAFEF